ncbi:MULTISPECIES: hypothetical protein [unclassified Sinorhizobium]|uniref:hypothetical protein n=1 Tax=unclassified Sinorhizobium TaxID=2613772 RepID=UPI003523D283
MVEKVQPTGTSGVGASGYSVAEADSMVEDELPPTALEMARAKAEADLEDLRDEIFALREHVAELRRQMRRVVQAERTSLNASAHAQLGEYPWIKLAAAFGATFVLARTIRGLPIASLIAILAQRRPD